jgi:CheY-like chemotaxis protein
MSAPGQGAHPRVLVVDDERPLADTLSLILQQHGYETAVAYSGEDAIKVARKFRPEFLLSDIKMPGISGTEAAISILHFLPRCSVLFISAAAPQDFSPYSQSRGLQDKLPVSQRRKFEICPKPIAPAALLEKIGEIFAANASPGLRVLNVDDDDSNRYAVTRILKRAGFEVEEAKTGAEALELARSMPDLILLDINLPDMSGFDVLRQLKTSPETAGIHIVQLTNTCKDDQSRDTALQLGAENFLTHPVEPEPLVSLLRKIATAPVVKKS